MIKIIFTTLGLIAIVYGIEIIIQQFLKLKLLQERINYFKKAKAGSIEVHLHNSKIVLTADKEE